jgi:predicted polyphosphate/ATP-dependent NAD kinase
VRRVGFVVNPIAGMGGRVGLKGTDGRAEEALARGAEPVSPQRAREMLRALKPLKAASEIRWTTCKGAMGSDLLDAEGFPPSSYEVATEPPAKTSAEDTKTACREFEKRGAELIVFSGGDGTCRDVIDAIDARLPILGVPAGVKMHSGAFGIHPATVATILDAWLQGYLRVGDAEVLDVDEEAYRRGEWVVRMYGTAKTLVEPALVQTGKMLFAEVTDDAMKDEIADHVKELVEQEPDTLFLLGPGSTVEHVAKRLGVENTLLGVDAVVGGKLVGRDLDEAGILKLLDRHAKAKLIVSPIGAQGFVLGRGNLQLSPAVTRRIGVPNVIVVATPAKLNATPVLRVDTGDADLDREFARKDYLFVVIGYRTSKLHPIRA